MQKIVILGAGESGIGAALLASQKGYDVFVSDGGSIGERFKAELNNHSISFEENGHSESKILSADEIIKSPGIPEKAPIMKKVRNTGIPVISEIEFSFRYIGNSKVIAITGSNGKTTTTALTYHIFKHSGESCAMVGNIGYSFARQIAIEPKDIYVVEISSFQLDDIQSFRPKVAVITNITEDHLDRYDYKIENYIASKFKIIQNQTDEDVFIYNLDDSVTMKSISNYPIKSTQAPITMSRELSQGAYLTNAQMHLKWKEEEMKMSIEDFAIKGKHNQYNSMAASMAATALDIRKEKIREALQTFQSLEHRMEFVATIKGVDFVNDSKDKMFAYVAVGSVKVQEFAKPIKFSVSRRKFREVANTWGYTVDEQPAGRTWTVAGSKGSEYVVTELDGVKTCTCPGFKFRGNCRHITQ